MPWATGQKWFTDGDREALSWLRQACESSRAEILARLPLPFALNRGAVLSAEDGSELTAQCWDDLMTALSGDTGPLSERLAAYGAHSACSGTDLRSVSEALEAVRRSVVHVLIERYASAPHELEGALYVMQRLFDRTSHAITREYLRYREALMEEQRRKEDLEHRHVRELEAENMRIQAASRLKSEFLANMSHELRTPLNSIIGFADLLHDREIAPDTPQHQEFLSDILKSARHLLKLINDVLDLAKVEAGKMEFQPEETDLAQLVSEVTDVLQTFAIERRVVLAQEVPENTPSVCIDPARLRQVLYNFLSNALKFTPAGGRVTIRAHTLESDQLRVEVEDTGSGIAPENLPRLFVEFEQLEWQGSVRAAGTGLGLALTKRIVEAQGGEVGVHSELGEGSTFWATLPFQLDCERPFRATSYFQELRPSQSDRPRESEKA